METRYTGNFNPTDELMRDSLKNEIPRRAFIEKQTPAEKAIYDAIVEVERAGAHPLLTEAVMFLSQAKDKGSDFVDLKL